MCFVVFWVCVGLSRCGVMWCVCISDAARGDGKSYSGYYKAPGRLLWETRDADVRARARGIRADAWFFCVCVSCVCRVASRRLFSRRARVRFVSLLFVRFFMHARRAPWNEWARHRPVDDRRYRSTSSFGRMKIVSCRSIVVRARAYRCTSPRARIAAAVGARDRANPSFEGTSSREIRASISSACTPGWSRGRACRAGGFWGASIAPWERARV